MKVSVLLVAVPVYGLELRHGHRLEQREIVTVEVPLAGGLSSWGEPVPSSSVPRPDISTLVSSLESSFASSTFSTTFQSSIPTLESSSSLSSSIPIETSSSSASILTTWTTPEARLRSSSTFYPASTLSTTSTPSFNATLNLVNDSPDLPGDLGFSGNPLVAIDTNAPPSNMPRVQHPLQPPAPAPKAPILTNKFYANTFLDSRDQPVWTHPYSIWWAHDPDCFSMSQFPLADKTFVYDSGSTTTQAHTLINANGVQQMSYGAAEFAGKTVNITSGNYGLLSAEMALKAEGVNGAITMPIVLGMGLVTAGYDGLTPLISSGVGIKSAVNGTATGSADKYTITLNDGTNWNMYVSSPSNNVPVFYLHNGKLTTFGKVSNLIVQLGVAPSSAHDAVYDSVAGAYPTGASLSASISGSTGTYSLEYQITGGGQTLIWALPHHVASLVSGQLVQQSVQLDTTVFGAATAVIGSRLQMTETLPTLLGFYPWSPSDKSGFDVGDYSDQLISLIKTTAATELNSDSMASLTDIDSMYYAGKAFDRLAYLVFTSQYIAGDETTAKRALTQLKSAFATFINNQQVVPLAYDTTWGGIVSSSGLQGDSGADFGNTFYNDHHFHYGYFVHAAALVAALDRDIGDGTWLAQSKHYINTLIKDVANPISDPYFPQFRSFDWYTGKSWAKGLFLSGDGKDEESSSEDYNFAYGMKLWARVIGDAAMEARANLMLAVLRRSMNDYILYSDDNTVVAPPLRGNKVSGILFENKIDYTTYFGNNTEYIHGIHMLPLTPASAYIRSSQFVQQEWDQVLDTVVSGLGTCKSPWKAILMLNQGIYDGQSSLDYFSGSQFCNADMDPGMSRAWSLALSGYWANV